MHRSLSVRALVLGLFFGLIWVGLPSFTSGGRIAAQEFPPFPVLYGGHVWINDEPAPPGTVLVARVGDYEASAVVEEDGLYRNLLVQPQSSDYYGQTVTFHAGGATAEEQDEFPRAGEPVFKTDFDLHLQLPEAESSPAAPVQATTVPRAEPDSASRLVLLIALLIAVGVAAVAGVLVALRKRYRHR